MSHEGDCIAFGLKFISIEFDAALLASLEKSDQVFIVIFHGF